MAAAATTPDLGDLLRRWRRLRGKSQLDLAADARTTPRYVSFVETGRSQPTRQMVVRLALALEVPLRERNDLLLAAGYAPFYPAGALDSGELARVDRALASMLDQHEPFPAVVLDRAWNVLRANDGAARLFGGLFAPDPLPAGANVLSLMLEPGPVRDAVRNWDVVAPALLERVQREAVGRVLDAATRDRLDRLLALPELAALRDAPPTTVHAPVLDVRFAFAGAELSFFSVVSTVGTPADVTAQELRLEAFFACDETTREHWVERCRAS